MSTTLLTSIPYLEQMLTVAGVKYAVPLPPPEGASRDWLELMRREYHTYLYNRLLSHLDTLMAT